MSREKKRRIRPIQLKNAYRNIIALWSYMHICLSNRLLKIKPRFHFDCSHDAIVNNQKGFLLDAYLQANNDKQFLLCKDWFSQSLSVIRRCIFSLPLCLPIEERMSCQSFFFSTKFSSIMHKVKRIIKSNFAF